MLSPLSLIIFVYVTKVINEESLEEEKKTFSDALGKALQLAAHTLSLSF